MPGWPISTTATGHLRSPVLFDIDNDGYLEIIFGQQHNRTNGMVTVFRYDGSFYPGWPQILDHSCVATPSVADIDNNGIVEICAVSSDSIYLWDKNGKLEEYWPRSQFKKGGDISYSQPTLADLDNDGCPEILVAYSEPSKDMKGFHQNHVGIFHYDGRPFIGWPQKYPGPQTFMCPVVGDVDEDDDLEIFNGGSVAGAPGFTGRHHTGEQLEGLWPVRVDFAECSPIIYDIDSDKQQEIVIGDNVIEPSCHIYAFNSDGTIVEGWPICISNGAASVNSLTVGDVDGDEDVELGLVTSEGAVNLWTFENTTYRGYLTEWKTFFHDNWNTGWYHPKKPKWEQIVSTSDHVILRWRNNTEQDVLGYNIYRTSADQNGFVKLNNRLIQDNVYVDENVTSGDGYYYGLTAVAACDVESKMSDAEWVEVVENNPPCTPSRPDGPLFGRVDMEYVFSTSGVDPDGDDLFYMFDWGGLHK